MEGTFPACTRFVGSKPSVNRQKKPLATGSRGKDLVFDAQLVVDQLRKNAEKFMHRSCRQELKGGPIPEFFDVHLEHLCELAIEPERLATGDPEGAGYRFIFTKAFLDKPDLLLKLLAHVRSYYERQTPIWKALRLQPFFRFRNEAGKPVRKSLEEMCLSDLQLFIQQHYGEGVEANTLVKFRSRLKRPRAI